MALPIWERTVETICVTTGKVLAVYGSTRNAGERIRSISSSVLKKAPAEFCGFLWNLTIKSEAQNPVDQSIIEAKVGDSPSTDEACRPGAAASKDEPRCPNQILVAATPHLQRPI